MFKPGGLFGPKPGKAALDQAMGGSASAGAGAGGSGDRSGKDDKKGADEKGYGGSGFDPRGLERAAKAAKVRRCLLSVADIVINRFVWLFFRQAPWMLCGRIVLERSGEAADTCKAARVAAIARIAFVAKSVADKDNVHRDQRSLVSADQRSLVSAVLVFSTFHTVSLRFRFRAPAVASL